MQNREARTVSRDVEVTAIPYGDRIPLKSGTTVYVTQSLGGAYTLFTDMGYLVRLDGPDADAIGEEPVRALSEEEQAGKSTRDLCWDQLKTCYDPEIPVNIVDLGLVYSCELGRTDDGRRKVMVQMTLTAPGCGMGDILVEDVRSKLELIPTIAEADVELTFDPPWNRLMMSEVAKLETGML